ncbi:MAG: HAD family hydrolase [Ruminococcaceae bacterium]|nr:HAD family hydrolase [Oscillospiraceae bacterium]
MSFQYVLFDLDGTLLPMDKRFDRAYFGGLCKRLAPHGYEPDALVSTIWEGVKEMVKNDGSRTNEEVFWDAFERVIGKNARADEPYFAAYYEEDFDSIAEVCPCDPRARQILDLLHEKKIPAVLATNPIFPAIATQKRMAWAGLSSEDFIFYTTYENFGYCKPNLDYYRAILKKIGAEPHECLMVGNDVDEDMVARELGMEVFLLTDCLLNRQNTDIEQYPHGNFDDLIAFLTKKIG